MANVIIKSDERKAQENYIQQIYGVRSNDKYGCEIAETISARTTEAYDDMKRLESKKYF